MALNLPLAAFRGVAIRLAHKANENPTAIAVVLEHGDPALSLPLYASSESDDIVAEWRESWGRVLGLPLLVAEGDGSLREPFTRLGAVHIEAAASRRRSSTTVARRRPARLLRRRPGDADGGAGHTVAASVRSSPATHSLVAPAAHNTFFRKKIFMHTFNRTSCSANRDRLQNGEVFTKFMSKLLNHPQVKPLLSDEHFSVDGTLIEAWASQKSFRPKDGSGDDDGANFHGQKRKNDTHASTSDPDSRLYRKAAGREAKLSYMGHATMENRHGLAVAGMVTHANGTAERRASEIMLKAKSKAAGRRITAGEDKAYDTANHVANLRVRNVTPHVTQNNSVTKTGRSRESAIDGRTTRHQGYGMSQSRRAMIECIFGWGKQHGTMRKTKHRGIRGVAADFMLNLIAYNLIRIPKLIAA